MPMWMLQKEGRACDQEHRNDKLAHPETSCFVPIGSVKGLDIVGHVDRGRFPRLVDVASPVSYTHLTLPTILRV